MSKKQKNKVGTALITGGAKRIGREIALNLAAQGYDLVISYKDSAFEAKKLAEEILQKYLVKCEIFQSDLSDSNQAKKLADFVIKNFSNWNLLINNASIFAKSKFILDSDSELFDNLNLHLISPLLLSKEFAKNVKKSEINNAQIINMIDKNITRYQTSYFYYLLSKKALAELTKMLALELAPEIRVNGIAPGFILNSIDEENPSKETEILINKVPLQSQGNLQNITQTIEFLIKNQYVSGQILFIDGAASLKD